MTRAWLFFALLCTPLLAADLSQSESFPGIDLDEDPLHMEKNEVLVIERLIEVNEARLVLQKQLKQKMTLFQLQKDAFIQGEQSQKHALAMVNNARDILGMIKEGSLSYLFPSAYLEELVFFSSIAGKSSPARP